MARSTWGEHRGAKRWSGGAGWERTVDRQLDGLRRHLRDDAPRFVYRYAPLSPDATWNHLLALATWFSRRAQEFAGSGQCDSS